MATKPKTNIKRDEFVKNVRPDPKSTEELVVLQGYIGDSNLDGHVRVYFDAALSDFIELPEQDILYSSQVEASENPLGGSLLWVKKTTVFTAGNPSHANRIKSSFLEGDLIKAYSNEGGKIPRAIAGAGNIPSDFVVGGCGPVTLQFEDCAPTGRNNPLCQIFEPPPATLPSECFKQTCVQPTCKFGCNISGNPFAICISVNNITCDLVLANQAVPRQPGTQAFTGGFNPYRQ